MKRIPAIWPLFCGLCFLLTGCGGGMSPAQPSASPSPTPAAAEVSAPPSPEPVPETPAPAASEPPAAGSETSGWPGEDVPLSQVDFSSYERELTPEDWEALSAFFPVLTEGESFLAAPCPESGKTAEATEALRLETFFPSTVSEAAQNPEEYSLASFSLCDLDGDGNLELILWSNDWGGWYLALFRGQNGFYGTYMPVRWFEMLQTNGVFVGSGGAATSYYQRLFFENGIFRAELLGNTDWGPYYAIAGQEVTEAEFSAWLEELLSGDAVWYAART